MSRRMIAVTVGILFFVQMATAIVGTTLIQAFVDGATERAPLTIGVLLMMCSGLAVVGIGLLMYQVLKSVNQRVAIWYPILRITEFTVSAACGIYLLIQLQVVPNHLLWVYIPTGIGGLVLSYLLFVSRLVPRPIAVLGFVGYGLFSLAVPLDLLGVLQHEWRTRDARTCSWFPVRVPGPADLADRKGICHTDGSNGIQVTGAWRQRPDQVSVVPVSPLTTQRCAGQGAAQARCPPEPFRGSHD